MFSPYAKREWLTILAIGLMLSIALAIARWYWLIIPVAAATGALLSFFRDPERRTPTQRGVMVSPADGRVTSVHRLDHFEPLGEPATCIRIFLSVFNVHVNRSPCHGRVESVRHKPGQHQNALKPQSAQVNESCLIVLTHPVRPSRMAAVRQVAGMLARSVACHTGEGRILQRGQRYGMIKLGSTTELYIPESLSPKVAVKQGDAVRGGQTVLAHVTVPQTAEPTPPPPTAQRPAPATNEA